MEPQGESDSTMTEGGMRCSTHSSREATATCARCNTQGCSECLNDVGGGLLCLACMTLRLTEAEAEIDNQAFQSQVIETQDAATRRIRRNWVLTGVFGIIAGLLLAASLAEDPGVPSALRPLIVPLGGVAGIYLVWAALWGVPAAWTWWRGLFHKPGIVFLESPFVLLVLVVSFFVVPLSFGYLYGVFGGAIHEYRKCRIVAYASS